jgi:hypothetical protein
MPLIYLMETKNVYIDKMSHNFRTGVWAKRGQTPQDHFKFLMNSTGTQRSFIHELSSQMMGVPPSNLWGAPIPQVFHHPADSNTLMFVNRASKHPAHEFGRIISSHKKASGWISGLGALIGDGAKAAAGYGRSVASWIGKNGKAIQQGVAITKDLVSTGATIAHIGGLITPGQKMTIDQISAAIASHASGEHYTGKAKTPMKTGGYFDKILI